MRIVRSLLLYGTLVGSSFLLYQTYTQTPCDTVIDYDIGVFDERFRIEENEFKEIIQNATEPWEQAAGRKLFRFQEGAAFKVNLRWSPEQERLYQGNDLSKDLDVTEQGIDSTQSRYQSAVTNYETSLRSYEAKLKKYERDVDFWNSKGGAPSDTYAELQRESKRLQKDAQKVNELRLSVNTLADENNERIEKYNQGVKEYNQLFQDGKEFDAGNTDGYEINVYSYNSINELSTLLIHEFGHVLGIEHGQDPRSVMFYRLNEENTKGKLSTEDIMALSVSCHLK